MECKVELYGEKTWVRVCEWIYVVCELWVGVCGGTPPRNLPRVSRAGAPTPGSAKTETRATLQCQKNFYTMKTKTLILLLVLASLTLNVVALIYAIDTEEQVEIITDKLDMVGH